MSTAGIFKYVFFLFSIGLSSCTKSDSKRDEALRIGSNFSLFTLDQYSLNSLNDAFFYKLIYDQAFYFKDDDLDSKFLKNLRIENKNLVFKSLNRDLYKDLDAAYSEGLKSSLWSAHFSKFEFSNRGLINKGYGSIEDLKIISSYWMLKGEKYGEYKLTKLIKNQRASLVSESGKKIKLYKIKSSAQGMGAITSNKLDVYLNKSLINSEAVLKNKNKLVFKADLDKKVFLRIYKKADSNPYLNEAIKKNISQINKVIDESFKMVECPKTDSVTGGKKSFLSKDLKLLFNNDLSQKIIDILVPEYKALSGKALLYEKLSAQKNAQRLSSGSFDYYFSLDIEKEEPELFYSALHSKGVYNSFDVKNLLLDQALDKKRVSWDLKKRKILNLKASKVLKALKHRLCEWEAPFYSVLLRPDKSLEQIKKDYKVDLN